MRRSGGCRPPPPCIWRQRRNGRRRRVGSEGYAPSAPTPRDNARKNPFRAFYSDATPIYGMVHNPRLCFQAKNLPIRAIHGNDALRSSRHARERADDEQRNPLGARGRRQMSESDLKPKDPRPSRLRSLSRLGLDPSEAASRKPKVRPIKTRFPSRACVLLGYTHWTPSRTPPRAALTGHRLRSRRVLPLGFIDERPKPAFSARY
jgi:hypothetical protein